MRVGLWLCLLGCRAGMTETTPLFEHGTSSFPGPALLLGRLVNMAYLAVVGSKAVNGVAAIHSEIIKEDIFPQVGRGKGWGRGLEGMQWCWAPGTPDVWGTAPAWATFPTRLPVLIFAQQQGFSRVNNPL